MPTVARVLLSFCGVLVLLLCAGCGRSDESSAVPVLRVGYLANLTHAQAVLAVSSGELAGALAPARLEMRIFNAGPSLVEAMVGGEIDIGYVGPGPAIAAYTATGGTGLRVISGAAANGVLIVARGDINARSLADLADRRIATPQHGNTQDIAARKYLRQSLGRDDLSNILPIANAEQLQLMQRRQVDAAWVPEPWGTLLMRQAGATLIAEEKDLWPDGAFATTIVVATPQFIKRHPELVSRFLEVHQSWTRRLQDEPQAQLPPLAGALFELTRKRLPDGVLEEAMANVSYTDDAHPQTIHAMARSAFELGFAKRPPKLEGMFHPVPQAAPLARQGE